MAKFTFKINDVVTYKDDEYVGTYNVVSTNPKEFWLQNTSFKNVYLKYNPDTMVLKHYG